MDFIKLFEGLKEKSEITEEQFKFLKTLQSPDQVNNHVQDRLGRQKEQFENQLKDLEGVKEENETLKSQVAEYEELKTSHETLKQQNEELSTKFQEADSQLKGINFKSLRDTKLAEKELPVSLPQTYLDLIPVTDNEEELNAGIDQVITRFKEENPQVFQFGGGSNPAQVEKSAAEMSISELISLYAKK